jgi:hypothetical protein
MIERYHLLYQTKLSLHLIGYFYGVKGQNKVSLVLLPNDKIRSPIEGIMKTIFENLDSKVELKITLNNSNFIE